MYELDENDPDGWKQSGRDTCEMAIGIWHFLSVLLSLVMFMGLVKLVWCLL